MRKVDLPDNHYLEILETIRELPINRFTDFQKYLIQDAGIGSSMSDVERHFSMLYKLIGANRTEEAARESYNLHFNIHLAINKISIRHLSFACLIYSIDGDRVVDLSEKNLLQVANRAGELGLTEGHVIDILEDVKKNSIQI
jgi:hypothetical protein